MPAKTQQTLLTVNCGSSSLKMSLFSILNRQNKTTSASCHDDPLALLFKGQVTHIGGDSVFKVRDAKGQVIIEQGHAMDNHEQALTAMLNWLEQENITIAAIGHRIVHGGSRFNQPTRITGDIIKYLQTLIPLAPNHQPSNLLGISLLKKRLPQVPQLACFDTAFHSTRSQIEQRVALPQTNKYNAIQRYGFHGLSYEYIASTLPMHLGELAEGKIIIAHLGHGASLCAIEHGSSVATTMTFTPLDGIPMGTRSGSLDPAVVLYLLQQGMSATQIADLLYFESGLLGLSGSSDDMQVLIQQASHANQASAFAINYFEHYVVRAIGSLAAAMGGFDAIIFTGGIGEHADSIRETICHRLEWLGLQIDSQANQQGKLCISHKKSKIQAWVIPTDEERMIARHSWNMLFNAQ